MQNIPAESAKKDIPDPADENRRMRAEIDALTKRLAALEGGAQTGNAEKQPARTMKVGPLKNVVALLAAIAVLAALAGASVVYGQDAAEAIDAIIINLKGNVGIGTADIPDEYRLDVKGSVLVEEGDLVVHSPNPRALTVTGAFTPTGGVEFRTEDETQGIGFGSNTIYATGTMTDQNLNLMARGTGAVNVEGELVVTSPNARALYVTGLFEPDSGVEFRHENETQGIGFGYNTIYATGSNEDQHLNLQARGAGGVNVSGNLNADTINASTINGEGPPMIFEIGDNDITTVDADNWRSVEQDIGPLCADGDGCTIKFLMRGPDTDVNRNIVLTHDVYINTEMEKNSGHTVRLMDNAHLPFQLGTSSSYSDGVEIIPRGWSWISVRDYMLNSDNTKVGFENQFQVVFSAAPDWSATVIVTDW